MNDLFNALNQPISIGGIVIIVIAALNVKVNRNEKDIACLRKDFKDQFFECMRIFKNKNTGGD